MVVASLIVFIKVEVIASFLPPIPLLGSRASLGWSCYCSLIKMKGASSLLAMEDGRPPAFQKLLLLSLPARKIEIPSFLQDSTVKAAHRRPSKSKDQRLQRNTLQTRLFVFFVGHVLIVRSLLSWKMWIFPGTLILLSSIYGKLWLLISILQGVPTSFECGTYWVKFKITWRVRWAKVSLYSCYIMI